MHVNLSVASKHILFIDILIYIFDLLYNLREKLFSIHYHFIDQLWMLTAVGKSNKHLQMS